MLKGKQHKLDKNKDGKISSEDFKMMGKKRGGSTPGLKDYVKKSDSQEKLIKVIENGITKFVKKSKVMDNPSKYTPAPSSNEMIKEKIMKRKGGGSAISKEKRKKDLQKKQNPISEYGPKGKLKYTAANQGGMMAKSTRGYGAARTSGMGLQDEQVKPGKVQKAALGALALGIVGKKMLDRKKKKSSGAPMIGAAAELLKKKKEILGKKTGGPVGKLSAPGNPINKERLSKLKQQLNRFKNKSTKGGGEDAGKIMSDKTKQSIKNLGKIIGRLSPGAKMGSDAGKILKEKLKKKTMTPAKKMGGGMMMKQYNKGGSVTASCKLGRNKATKLY